MSNSLPSVGSAEGATRGRARVPEANVGGSLEAMATESAPDVGPSALVDLYAARARGLEARAGRRRARVRLVARARLVVFVVAALALWRLAARGGAGPLEWVALSVAALAFAALVVRHGIERRRLDRAERMADFNREGVARIERRWSDLPPPWTPESHGEHDYASDLDLFGHASLLHLAGVCSTAPGRRTLERWLLAAADPAAIERRRAAVVQLARERDFRDRLVAEGRSVEEGGSEGLDEFLAWAESPPWTLRRRWLPPTAVALALTNAAAVALYSVQAIPGALAALPLVVSAVLWRVHRGRIEETFAAACGGESGVRRYARLLDLLARAPGDADGLADLRRRLDDEASGRASKRIAALGRLLDMAEARRSPLLHLPLAIVLLWDVHATVLLERWKVRSGRSVRDWLDAAGDGEALAALATLKADHPEWTMPAVDPSAASLDAKGLGHPLLAPRDCVGNDVSVGPPGTFLLVTGSNMSGKSTLLKAIGVNAALAQAGGPVCARELRMPPLAAVTSVRVSDSLVDGLSFFMAELKRLKRVVDRARASVGPEPRVLYLLDEILQGTNSAERKIATRAVLRGLLATRAIGAVSTHDLALADAADLTERATAVHFTETVDEDGMTFDYRLRPGVATSTNALRLLERVGLGSGAAERREGGAAVAARGTRP